MNSNLEDIIGRGKSFVENKVLNTHRNILVKHKVEVVGNNFAIMDDMYISEDCSFINVIFKGAMIFIQDCAHVEFIGCKFQARNSLTSIVAQINGDIHMSFRQCEFKDFYTAINANNNFMDVVEDNCFINCRVALELENHWYINDTCTDNVMLCPKEYVFISIKSQGTVDKNIIRMLQEITIKNNGGRIICYEGSTPVADTKCFYAKNEDILRSNLSEATDGNIFFLGKGEFKGQYDILKSIMIIGEEGTIITPTAPDSIRSALLIESDYITIKNIKISNNNTITFRDGIRFSDKGGTGCLLYNVIIENVKRRGISIWGQNNGSTTIKQCFFLNIIEGCGVFAVGAVIIKECWFQNCKTAINGRFSQEMNISLCDFQWVDELLLLKENNVRSVRVENNNYLRTNVFLNILE